ncbi:Cysteine protease avirulence protein AvrPphB [Bradyrhizobium ivorense]|uniref:Cysteine protease avirulence protein AvrPphB n=1 Tax=Bradyrhizobium ivorense TaxID=2511166 RepID=A0A508T860_9BRAD|nr:YopT-type cysteine protease domain-containing protein [Bradyrhizobium ivorense]VIO69955.1 Cysteine protease avirulence protein AvrPphB [Bradyrhizobium ivorense]VIO70421.1 Cysteine protease avirulence protein AvrPphB [Bradyrhizobium ivorense]
MYNRVSGQSIGSNRADEPGLSVDSGSFAQELAECAQQESLSDGELPDQMGSCCSRPHTSDANVYSPGPSDSSTSSLSSDSSSSSPARPIRALFEYRTAELPGANVNGICVGLAAEWLLNLHSSPSSRMSALHPGAQNHASAAARQQRYAEIKTLLRNDGAAGSHNLQARSTMLHEAGLQPSAEQTRYRFGSSSRIAQIVNEVTADPSIYLIGLRFAAGGGHTIATSTSNGMTTLFDPNYGEFTVRSDQMGEVFKSLAERYRNPNQHDISTVVTQRMA